MTVALLGTGLARMLTGPPELKRHAVVAALADDGAGTIDQSQLVKTLDVGTAAFWIAASTMVPCFGGAVTRSANPSCCSPEGTHICDSSSIGNRNIACNLTLRWRL